MNDSYITKYNSSHSFLPDCGYLLRCTIMESSQLSSNIQSTASLTFSKQTSKRQIRSAKHLSTEFHHDSPMACVLHHWNRCTPTCSTREWFWLSELRTLVELFCQLYLTGSEHPLPFGETSREGSLCTTTSSICQHSLKPRTYRTLLMLALGLEQWSQVLQ